MGLFSRGKSGGMMNVIRCDQEEYLVWKWRPLGQEVNSTSRENAIRFGSTLTIKDGEVAVFQYAQKDGTQQDYIEGPYNGTIKTANFPILSGIMGMAFGGDSPFQAEIYFINLAGTVQIKFAIPYFNVFDPRFPDMGLPVAVGGSLTFRIDDYKAFIRNQRLRNFDIDQLKTQVKDAVTATIKNAIINCPHDNGLPVMQLERKILDINDICKPRVSEALEDFGVTMRRLDISRIEIDKEADTYSQLQQMTTTQQQTTINAQTAVNVKNLSDMQQINARNLEDTMRIQREEAQRAQRLATETQYIGAHALNRQADILETAASGLGSMGGSMGSGGGGFNPAGMMTGMMMGGAVGGQMANMVNTMGNAMNGQYASQIGTPPPPPQVSFMISVNGQQAGPFNMSQLQQMAQSGQLTRQTYVWRQGMAGWELAGNVADLQPLFAGSVPPPPPPPMP